MDWVWYGTSLTSITLVMVADLEPSDGHLGLRLPVSKMHPGKTEATLGGALELSVYQ